MIDHFLYRYIQDRVKELLEAMLPALVGERVEKKLAAIVKMDPKAQYLVFTETEEDARLMIDAMRRHLDPESLPRIVILAGKEPRFLEIGQKES